jgi:hypothetical protein
VRALMEGLHKAMLKRLTRGECDEGILVRLGPGAFDGLEDTGTDTLPPAEPARAAPSPARVQAAQEVRETPKEQLARVFGDSVVSKKPLDEVVLDYLVENARKRKRGNR